MKRRVRAMSPQEALEENIVQREAPERSRPAPNGKVRTALANISDGRGLPRRESEATASQRDAIAAAVTYGQRTTIPNQAMARNLGPAASHIAAYTGPDNQLILGALGINGVATEKGVAFREPAPAPSLVAHELTHVAQMRSTQQRSSSTTASESEAHRSETISRSPEAALRVVPPRVAFDWPPDFAWRGDVDMTEINWGETEGLRLPNAPLPDADRALTQVGQIETPSDPIQDTGPRPPPIRCNPGHHQQTEPSFDFDMWDPERTKVWRAFGSDAAHVSRTFNSSASAHNSFEHITESRADQLREAQSFVIENGSQGNLHSVLNDQPAGGSDSTRRGSAGERNPLQIGKLFETVEVANVSLSVGEEVELSNRASAGIDRAAGDLDRQFSAVRAKDAALASSVEGVRSKAAEVDGAKSNLLAACDRIELTTASRGVSTAQADRQALQQKVDSVKADIDLALQVVAVVGTIASGGASGLGGVAATAGPVTSSQRFASGVAYGSHGDGGGGIVSSIANRLVDALYADDILAADARIAAAIGRFRAVEDNYNIHELETAQHNVIAKLASLRSAQSTVVGRLNERTLAYNALGSEAADESGTRGDDRNRIRGSIAAIPAVEAVVAAISNVTAAIDLPSYSTDSGQGLGMAHYHHGDTAAAFLLHVAWLKGMRDLYEDRGKHWETRLGSMRAIMQRLSGQA